jgi:Mn2+/Fe2+ NRAMP family transporter
MLMAGLRKIIASLLPGIFIIGYNVGTGSITSMSKAGANFGLDLLWAIAISFRNIH